MHDDTALLEHELRALSAPREEDELLRLALRRSLAAPPPRRRHRRTWLRVAVPAGLAAAAVAVAVAVLGGSRGTGAADAAILHRTLAAVTPVSGTILHVKTVDVENGVQFVGEWWQETSPPYASRGMKGSPGRLSESADDGTTSYAYDPGSNTIYEQPDTSPPTYTDPISQTRQELADGQARLAGTTTIDGQPLYEIALSNGVTEFVDEATYVPRYLDEPQRNGPAVRLQVVTYEQLPVTPDNLKLLSITAQHPDARVDANPSDAPPGLGK